MTDKLKELLPCPFCGAVPELKKVGRDWYRIEHPHATECLLDSITFDYGQIDEGLSDGVGDWNRRAPLPAVEDAEIEVAAREIYESWEPMDGYVPWAEAGNSFRQHAARSLARRILAGVDTFGKAVELEIANDQNERMRGLLKDMRRCAESKSIASFIFDIDKALSDPTGLAGVNQPSEFYVESDLLRSALGFCGIAAPESDEELGFNSASYAKKVVRKLAKIDRAGGVNQQAGSVVPEGFVLVPKEPTVAMRTPWKRYGDSFYNKYKAMLAAAPLPPSPAPIPRQPAPHSE